MWKALLFFSVWIGITIPILLSIVFTIFKPLVLADETGISMIVIATIVPVVIFISQRVFGIESKRKCTNERLSCKKTQILLFTKEQSICVFHMKVIYRHPLH